MGGEVLAEDLFDEDRLLNQAPLSDSAGAGTHDSGASRGADQQEEPALKHLCAEIYARISAFLQDAPPSDLVRRVQEQTQRSLGIIREALDRYSYVASFFFSFITFFYISTSFHFFGQRLMFLCSPALHGWFKCLFVMLAISFLRFSFPSFS
jgi:hypothetical protein